MVNWGCSCERGEAGPIQRERERVCAMDRISFKFIFRQIFHEALIPSLKIGSGPFIENRHFASFLQSAYSCSGLWEEGVGWCLQPFAAFNKQWAPTYTHTRTQSLHLGCVFELQEEKKEPRPDPESEPEIKPGPQGPCAMRLLALTCGRPCHLFRPKFVSLLNTFLNKAQFVT